MSHTVRFELRSRHLLIPHLPRISSDMTHMTSFSVQPITPQSRSVALRHPSFAAHGHGNTIPCVVCDHHRCGIINVSDIRSGLPTARCSCPECPLLLSSFSPPFVRCAVDFCVQQACMPSISLGVCCCGGGHHLVLISRCAD